MRPVIFIFCLVAFGRVFFSDYVTWDDRAFVTANTLLDLPFEEFVLRVFTHFFHGDYLPVTLISYWLEVAIFGRNAEVQHVINLILHLANISLVCSLFRRLTGSPAWTGFVTAVFALHPLQVESVMWISERKGLLSAFFALTAAHFSGRPGTKNTALYFAFFALSLLAKLNLILLPVFLLFTEWRRERRGPLIAKHMGPLLIAVVIGLVRTYAYQTSHPELWEEAARGGRLLELPLSLIDGFGFFLSKFLWPADLSIIYPAYVWNAFSWIHLIAVVAGVFVVWLGRASREVWIFAAAFILFLLPSLPVVPRINFVNDRFVYLAIVGPAGLLFSLLRTRDLRHAWIVVAVILTGPSFVRARVWENNEALWVDTALKRPESGMPLLNLGEEYGRQNRVEEAIATYQKLIDKNPADGTVPLAHGNLALIFQDRDLAAAERHMRAGLAGKLTPNDRMIMFYNYSGLLLQKGERERALAVLDELAASLAAMPDLKNHQLIELVERRRRAR